MKKRIRDSVNRMQFASVIAFGAMLAVPAGAAILNVGPGAPFSTISAAVAAAKAGDVVMVKAGLYTNDFPVVNVPLTIKSTSGRVILNSVGPIPNQKAIVITNTDATLKGIEFQNAMVTDASGGNGAGIRYQGGKLVVENCVFFRNQDGILAAPSATGSILVDHSVFRQNGSGTGYTHAIYAGAIGTLTVQNSNFQGTKVGHDVKSRAAVTNVFNNDLDDGTTGTTSYAIDIPNGGVATVSGNLIHQGPRTQNITMMEYAAEGEVYTNNSLLVSGNQFINTLPGRAIGVYNWAGNVSAQLVGNTFVGVSDPLVGLGAISTAASASH